MARTVRECERAFLKRADEPRLRCIKAGEGFKDLLTTPVKEYDYVGSPEKVKTPAAQWF